MGVPQDQQVSTCLVEELGSPNLRLYGKNILVEGVPRAPVEDGNLDTFDAQHKSHGEASKPSLAPLVEEEPVYGDGLRGVWVEAQYIAGYYGIVMVPCYASKALLYDALDAFDGIWPVAYYVAHADGYVEPTRVLQNPPKSWQVAVDVGDDEEPQRVHHAISGNGLFNGFNGGGTLNWSKRVLRGRGWMDLNFSTEDASFQGKRLHGALAELENAVIALFWEGEEPRLGTLTVTLPTKVSSPLLGDRDRLIGQLLGEHLAAIYGKIALVSTNLSVSTGSEAGSTLIDLARRLTGRREMGVSEGC